MTTRKDNILAFTWYHEHDYDKLLEVTDNPEGLAPCYEDWLLGARQALVKYKQLGFRPQRVYVDVDEYLAWCDRRDRRVDGQSREMFKEIKRQEFYRRVDRET